MSPPALACVKTETDKKMRRQEITVIFLAYHIDERILCFHFAFLTSTTHFSPFPIGDDTESTGLLNCFFTFSSRMLSDASIVL